MKKVLVTGATGFIGLNLIPILISRGYEVHAVCRLKSVTRVDQKNCLVHVVDDYRDLGALFQQYNYYAVVHLATIYDHAPTYNKIDEMLSSNIMFGVHLLEAMKLSACRYLINTTTTAEFNQQGEFSPNSLYSASKRAFRDVSLYYKLCQDYRIIDLVLYDNYGLNDPRKKITSLILDHLYSQEPIKLSPGHQEINLIHISDTVRAISKAVDDVGCLSNNSKQCLFCLAPDKAVTIRQLVKSLERLSGKKMPALWGEIPYRGNEIMSPWVGERLPNWKAQVNLDQGLLELLNHQHIDRNLKPVNN